MFKYINKVSLLAISVVVTFLSSIVGCGEPPTHASEIGGSTTEATPTDSRFVLEGDYFRARVDLEEDWIIAHTYVYLWIPHQDDDTFEAYLKHVGEQLTVGEVEIEQDSFLLMEGTLLRSAAQIYLYREELGYELEYDANISTSGTTIDGYFTFQEDYRVYAEFSPVLGY